MQANHLNYWIQIIFVLKIILRLGNIKLSIHLNKLAGLVLLCLAFFSSGLVAQENKFSLSSYGGELSSDPNKFLYFNNLDGVLFLTGSIEKGMYTIFRQAITENKIHTIVLNSSGGDVDEGLNIAGTIFDKEIKTYIPEGYKCYSACSFIFFAGSEKYALGELGVHQAAYADDISKEKAAIGAIDQQSQKSTADILLRLGEFNTPRFVEQRMLRTAPGDMYIFNETELNKLGNLDVSNNNKALFKDIDEFIADFQKYYAEQDCDNDVKKCTSTQLCQRAAANKSWNKGTNATKYVIAAKGKGLTCGVPAPVCPEDIKKCNEEYLCTYGTTGLDTSLSWLNNSFSDEAKIRGYMCGIISKPNIKTEKKKPKCYQNAKSCNNEELCMWSTQKLKNNVRVWNPSDFYDQHIEEAKVRGLSCGVTVFDKNKIQNTCYQDPIKCNNERLCQVATKNTSNGKEWKSNLYWQKHVTEAIKRKLSCGVKIKTEIKTKSCVLDIKNCTSKQLCARGTKIVNSNFLWQTNINFEKYVTEAKRRGLSCGVKETKQISRKFFTTTGKTNVFYIQSYLNKLGCQAGKPDGLLGQSTIDALTRWEEYGGKYPIEKLDMNLRTHLKNSNISCGKLETIKNQKNGTIKEIQTNLNELGCNAGNADGILGSKTFSALQRWKSASGNKTININDISEQPSKILAVLKFTSLKCEKTKRFPSVAGTWKISYNNCNKNIKNPYLHLSVISSKKLYESFLHTDYQRLHLTGKLNVQDRNFKLKLNGKTGRLLTKSEEMLVTGTFNEALNIIDGTDQNGCIFKGTKLDQNTYFDGTGITRKK